MEAPAYALLGISVGAARSVVLLSFVVATAIIYILVHKRYGAMIGVLAASLFALSPHIVILSNSVLSEMLALALVLAALYSVERFCAAAMRASGWLRDVRGAEPLRQAGRGLRLPMFLFIAVQRLGIRRLLRPDIPVAAGTMAVLLTPLVVMTMSFSGINVSSALVVLSAPTETPFDILHEGLGEQFAVPAMILFTAGMVRAVYVAWRRQDLVPFAWAIGAVVALAGMVELTPVEPGRYGIYAVPMLCMLAAFALSSARGPVLGTLALAVGGAVLVAQGLAASSRPPVRSAEGYEAAARFVLQSNPGPTVLFSGDIDTGFFTFFVRKHDAERRPVVLRADKMLTTSFMGMPSIEDRIAKPDEIYAILKRFGTRYVVLEDRTSASKVLEWLRAEARTAHFAERQRIPIRTSDVRLRGTDVVVYKFLEATPPDPDARLSINLPVIGQSVNVTLSDHQSPVLRLSARIADLI